MKIRMLTAAAVLSLSFAGVAFADAKVTASLATPVAAKTKVVAAGALFTCEGSTCVANSAIARTVTVAGCKELVKAVGAVTTMTNGKRSIEGQDLATCNAVAN